MCRRTHLCYKILFWRWFTNLWLLYLHEDKDKDAPTTVARMTSPSTRAVATVARSCRSALASAASVPLTEALPHDDDALSGVHVALASMEHGAWSPSRPRHGRSWAARRTELDADAGATAQARTLRAIFRYRQIKRPDSLSNKCIFNSYVLGKGEILSPEDRSSACTFSCVKKRSSARISLFFLEPLMSFCGLSLIKLHLRRLELLGNHSQDATFTPTILISVRLFQVILLEISDNNQRGN